jgi:hypothetical protein
MSKEERISKFRKDDIDEVDTTEMEYYLTKRHPLMTAGDKLDNMVETMVSTGAIKFSDYHDEGFGLQKDPLAMDTLPVKFKENPETFAEMNDEDSSDEEFYP